jgi:hypothetical protein
LSLCAFHPRKKQTIQKTSWRLIVIQLQLLFNLKQIKDLMLKLKNLTKSTQSPEDICWTPLLAAKKEDNHTSHKKRRTPRCSKILKQNQKK